LTRTRSRAAIAFGLACVVCVVYVYVMGTDSTRLAVQVSVIAGALAANAWRGFR
jgi:hypothetical protein